jgi:uncharacterized protein (TIGR02996 family)
MTLHPEAEALLNAIYDHPDDDTPRLVYADWLQEHGQENYAQFIRLQCAAAREQLWSAEANRLWEEIGRVWNRLYYEWMPALEIGWGFGNRVHQLDAVHFERGFLSSRTTITCEHFAYCDRFWDWLPTRAVVLAITESTPALVAACANGQLRRISQVRIIDGISQTDSAFRDALNAFLRQPTLCNVEALDLAQFDMTNSTLEVLLSSPNLQRVSDLHIRFDFVAEGDDSLVETTFKETLSDLRKRFTHVTYETD